MALQKTFGAAFVVAAALLVGGVPPASGQRAKPLARVGIQDVTPAEITALLGLQPDEVRQQLLANPKRLAELLRSEAERRAVLMEARGAGVDTRPEVAVLMQRAQEQALLSAYLTPRLAVPRDYPSEREIAGYYENNKQRFLIAEQVNVSTIFLLVLPAWARDKALEEKIHGDARWVAAEAKKGGDFAELARLHSQDRPTAENGGSVGWVTAAQLLPELAQAGFTLKPGEISDPIRTQLGYHILRVNDRKPMVQRSLAEVREGVIQLLHTEYRLRKEREAIDAAVKLHPVLTDGAAIEQWRSEEVAAAAKK
jgi:parvulin-like peptidyl-prolyl isomerase